jgi:hypothetical protein
MLCAALWSGINRRRYAGLLLVATLAVAACQPAADQIVDPSGRLTSSPRSAVPSAPQPSQASASPVGAAIASGYLDGITLEVISAFQATSSDVRLPPDDDVWCAELTVHNGTRRSMHVDRHLGLNWPAEALIGMDDHGGQSAVSQLGKHPGLTGTIAAGDTGRGYVCWQVPAGHRLARILWTSPAGNILALRVA